ncbi:MAG: porin, partial [Gammaproteobacteria bacterium]|nr:porin [Gammaproteobacteria bacterium]
MNFKKLALAIVCAGGAMAATVPAQAANWLMLQGTERDSAAGRAKVWGFIQPEAQYVKGTTVQAGAWKGSPMQANTIAPDRASTATMNIRRARIGVRGQGFPLDGKTNYFILAELGHNGITAPGPNRFGATYLTDASVTLNHIPGARFRVGMFKTPGAEEGLQAIHVFDYINFTSVTDQLLLERYFAHDGSGTYVKSAADNANAGGANPPITGVGAFRDIGAQLFDTFKFGAWEASYAAMIGNGNGLNAQDNNNAKDYYGYMS